MSELWQATDGSRRGRRPHRQVFTMLDRLHRACRAANRSPALSGRRAMISSAPAQMYLCTDSDAFPNGTRVNGQLQHAPPRPAVSLSVIIPVYNEPYTLREILHRVQAVSL